MIPEFSIAVWALLAVAAVFVGVSKTALPGINTISIAIFAAAMPAKASTAALLLLLIVGDVFALAMYRRHVDWPTLARLAPAVLVGLALGAVFLAIADDGWVRRAIGVILLLLVGFTLWLRSRPSSAEGAGGLARMGYGSLGGFTTMVANAGGAPMSMYFLAARFPVKAFLGTAAWFFAILNIIKVPISAGLGLITPTTLAVDLLLVPGVVAGALLGRWITSRISQKAFDAAVIVFTVLGAIYLLIS